MRDLSAAALREVLRYEPETGEFFWKVSRSMVSVGARAGNAHPSGYVRIGLFGRQYRAHRLAWLYTHGAWPLSAIDHINGIRDDNRISNLRAVSQSLNMQNVRRARKDNKTGYLGVSWREDRGKFVAVIHAGGQQVYLGEFDSAEVAHAAYIKAKGRLHPGAVDAWAADHGCLLPRPEDAEYSKWREAQA